MTLDDLKKRLEIPLDDHSQDAKLEVDLEDAIDFVKEWCNNDFPDGLPGGVKRAIVTLIKSYSESKNVQSQRLGDMSKTFFEGGSLQSVYKELRPYKKVKFV